MKKYVLYTNRSFSPYDWAHILATPRLQNGRQNGNTYIVEAEQEVIDALLVLFPDLRATEQKKYHTAS